MLSQRSDALLGSSEHGYDDDASMGGCRGAEAAREQGFRSARLEQYYDVVVCPVA